MRYKTAPIGLSLSQHAEYCRNIYFGLALTAFGTGECATEVEGECVDTDALVAGHDTKQNATPAAKFGQIVGSFDDLWISGAVNCDIG